MKRDLTENKPKEDKDQTLESSLERDKCNKVSEDMSLREVQYLSQ